jgi:hypothetical protein
VFVAENFTLKMDKILDFKIPAMWQEHIKKRPDLFTELKSWSMYQHTLGTYGGVVEYSEFDSFEDYRRWLNRLLGDEDFAPLLEAYNDSVVSGSWHEAILDKVGSWAGG